MVAIGTCSKDCQLAGKRHLRLYTMIMITNDRPTSISLVRHVKVHFKDGPKHD